MISSSWMDQWTDGEMYQPPQLKQLLINSDTWSAIPQTHLQAGTTPATSAKHKLETSFHCQTDTTPATSTKHKLEISFHCQTDTTPFVSAKHKFEASFHLQILITVQPNKNKQVPNQFLFTRSLKINRTLRSKTKNIDFFLQQKQTGGIK